MSLKVNLRSLGRAVLLPKMAVRPHCQGTAIGVPEPPRDSWNIHPRLDAAGGKEVAEIVVRDRLHAGSLTRRTECSFAFLDVQDRCVRRLIAPACADFLQKLSQRRKKWNHTVA